MGLFFNLFLSTLLLFDYLAYAKCALPERFY